jgi:hypothetical protein
MTNPGKVDPGNSKADYPAYDTSAPLLFKKNGLGMSN